MSNSPVVVDIQKHYGSSGKYRLVIQDYLGEKGGSHTREIVGYYKTDDGVIERATSKAEKYHTGEWCIPSGDGRPTEISLPQIEDRDEFRDLVETALDLEDLDIPFEEDGSE